MTGRYLGWQIVSNGVRWTARRGRSRVVTRTLTGLLAEIRRRT